MAQHKLTDVQIRQAKIGAKLSDGSGLHLYVTPSGSKLFRLRYRFNGKATMGSLGRYHPGQPDHVSLAEARAKAAQARAMLKEGINPTHDKRNGQNSEPTPNPKNTFEKIALDWIETKKAALSEQYAETIEKRIRQNLCTKIGQLDIADITAPILREALNEIQAPYLRRRMKGLASNVLSYGAELGHCQRDVSAEIKTLPKPPRVQHRKSMKLDELPLFFQRLEQSDNYEITKLALHFIIITALRTAEVRYLTYDEVENLNSANPLIRIPPHKMKKHREHLVPLSPQAVTIIKKCKELYPYSKLIFPSQEARSGIMSENCLLYALYKLGWWHTATVHGFRSLFSSTAHQQNWLSDAIEAQLSHFNDSSVKSAYNSAIYLQQRRELLLWWANLIDNYRNKNP